MVALPIQADGIPRQLWIREERFLEMQNALLTQERIFSQAQRARRFKLRRASILARRP
jgi:hypothetical protein